MGAKDINSSPQFWAVSSFTHWATTLTYSTHFLRHYPLLNLELSDCSESPRILLSSHLKLWLSRYYAFIFNWALSIHSRVLYSEGKLPVFPLKRGCEFTKLIWNLIKCPIYPQYCKGKWHSQLLECEFHLLRFIYPEFLICLLKFWE